jgi:hypothetical protein
VVGEVVPAGIGAVGVGDDLAVIGEDVLQDIVLINITSGIIGYFVVASFVYDCFLQFDAGGIVYVIDAVSFGIEHLDVCGKIEMVILYQRNLFVVVFCQVVVGLLHYVYGYQAGAR